MMKTYHLIRVQKEEWDLVGLFSGGGSIAGLLRVVMERREKRN
jgi:hypothetical protein